MQSLSRTLPILLLLWLASSPAYSQATQTGKITKLFVLNGGTQNDDSQRVIIRLEGDVTGGLCSKKTHWQMLLTNHAEKAQYDLLLASYMNAKQVKIWGHPDKKCIHKGEQVRNVEIVL